MQRIDPDAAQYLLQSVKRWVCMWDDYTELGVYLEVDSSCACRIQSENPHSILQAAFTLVSTFYTQSVDSKAQKLAQLHRVLFEELGNSQLCPMCRSVQRAASESVRSQPKAQTAGTRTTKPP